MKHIQLAAAAVAGMMMISGCSVSNGKTAIKVGDKTISEGTIKFVAENLMNNPDIQKAADTLGDAYLVREIADKTNSVINEDEQATVKSNIASIKSQLGGKKEADKMLKAAGVDDSVLELVVTQSDYTNRILQDLDVQDPTDDEMHQYFKDNYYRAKHVLIATSDLSTGAEFDDTKKTEAQAKAQDVLAQAQGGADFNTLVAQFNEDPGMTSNPDGYVFTDGAMVAEFEDTVKSLEPGGIAMCQTDYGYHIIERLALDETPEMFEKFYTDNQSAIKKAAKNAKEQEAIKAKGEELGITVEENQSVIDSIKLEPKATATPGAK